MISDPIPNVTRQIFLARHPAADIQAGDFEIRQTSFAPADAGLVITKTTYMSLDPYLAFNIGKARAAAAATPYPMRSRTLGKVVHAGDSSFAIGDMVLGFGDWRDCDMRPASELRKIDVSKISPELYLGALGHSGFTAWLGLKLGGLSEGETILISAAAGAVGSAAGQLARRAGCRVIGIAGGTAKTRWVTEKLGFHACVDHTTADFHDALAREASAGIDMVFENVGAKSLDPALLHLKPRGRVMLCGLIEHYQDHEPVCLRNFRLILQKSIRIEPFSIYDHEDKVASAQSDLLDAAASGHLVVEQTVSEGFDSVPEAFVAMLAGRGRGKHLVRVG